MFDKLGVKDGGPMNLFVGGSKIAFMENMKYEKSNSYEK